MLSVAVYLFLQCYLMSIKIKKLRGGCNTPEHVLVRSHFLLEQKFDISNMPATNEKLHKYRKWNQEFSQHINAARSLKLQDPVESKEIKLVVNND